MSKKEKTLEAKADNYLRLISSEISRYFKPKGSRVRTAAQTMAVINAFFKDWDRLTGEKELIDYAKEIAKMTKLMEKDIELRRIGR
jgi:acetyl-CoA carboxylase alpha subunit